MRTTWAALAVFLCLGSPASAQELTPAELPPQGFEGDRYVDSRGCVFLRADVGDTSVFVPRLTRERRLVCGETPTLAGISPQTEPQAAGGADAPRARPRSTQPRAEVAPDGALDLDPKSAREPIVEPPRAAQRRAAAPAAQQRQRPLARGAPEYLPGPTVGGELHRLPAGHSGGVVVDADGYVILGRVREAVPDMRPPHGYRRAWNDGRLNPHRGPKAFAGAEQSARVWTRTVPRKLRERPIATVVTPAVRAPAYAAHRHVYVGGVRDVAQARRVAASLPGLPIRFQKGPRGLIVVLAGPYGAEAQAAAALATVQRRGYAKAYIR